jgi:hypothetical protein
VSDHERSLVRGIDVQEVWFLSFRRPSPKLPPGPAFIPEPPGPLPWPYENLRQWRDDNVPEGYRHQPATNWTGAGWVRPHGR